MDDGGEDKGVDDGEQEQDEQPDKRAGGVKGGGGWEDAFAEEDCGEIAEDCLQIESVAEGDIKGGDDEKDDARDESGDDGDAPL